MNKSFKFNREQKHNKTYKMQNDVNKIYTCFMDQ